jgi:hypothetical protein
MNITNPILSTAMGEIKSILEKHDIAAHVILSSGEQCEYLSFVCADGHGPSWSCLYSVPGGVRFKSKASIDHKERFKMNSTVKMLFSIRELMIEQLSRFFQITEMLENEMDIEHGESRTQTSQQHFD